VTELLRCSCGWKRPRIAVSCPVEFVGEIVVVVECPVCGEKHSPGQMTAVGSVTLGPPSTEEAIREFEELVSKPKSETS
jgi:hypothetical protein